MESHTTATASAPAASAIGLGAENGVQNDSSDTANFGCSIFKDGLFSLDGEVVWPQKQFLRAHVARNLEEPKSGKVWTDWESIPISSMKFRVGSPLEALITVL